MPELLLKTALKRHRMLVLIKVIHTGIWAFFVGCILALPVAGGVGRFDWVMILTGFVLFECGALALNSGVCPLTPLAARFTSKRSPGFDIYLPEWFAKNNKIVFGTLFVVNEAIVLWQWSRR